MDIYKNSAFLTLEEDECYGKVHPRDAMLPEIVLLVCSQIRQELQNGTFEKQSDESIVLTKQRFSELLLRCRRKWLVGWSKEYREMTEEKFADAVKEYMKNWMLIRETAGMIFLMPAVGRQVGFYPEDFEEAK